MKKIPKSEFLEHFEDVDFLKVYGEPLLVEDEMGDVLVFLSKELYQELVKPQENAELAEMIVDKCKKER